MLLLLVILLVGVITSPGDDVCPIDGAAKPSRWIALGLINFASINARVFWVSSNFEFILATSNFISSQTLF